MKISDKDRRRTLEYLSVLHELGAEMEDGIQGAEALWENLTMCKSSPDDIFEMDVQLHGHEVSVFAEHLTQLIGVENTLLNIIEQYQFYLESSVSYDGDNVYRNKSSPIHVRNPSAHKKGNTCVSPNTIRDIPFDCSNGVTTKLLQYLQVNSHIDRVCKCTKLFNTIRRLLMQNEEEAVEVKVIEADIMNITGSSPTTSNDLLMLEKMHGKFKRKLTEYEEIVFQINQNFLVS
ncbi:rdgA [Acrasis kona]|uniref:RdgA n=1 Tax=Acrasis kona TaxID=1008807 RepID=A0AAW2YJB9_9EUKA